MTQVEDNHLVRLSDPALTQRLNSLGLDWSTLDTNACAALRFLRQQPNSPTAVGLIGGASSGKSTLFNTILGLELSRISAHAHETLGPVAAVPPSWMEQISPIDRDRSFLGGMKICRLDSDNPSAGTVNNLSIAPHEADGVTNTCLIDLPDVTTKMSADEGSTARMMLPWFDGLIIVVDEERWFDASVFEDTADFARNFGPRMWLVFNRTERSEPLSPDARRELNDHALRRHADGSCISPFQPGRGYRPLSTETRDQIVPWLNGIRRTGRTNALIQYLRGTCGQIVHTNVTRAEQYSKLCHRVDKELASLAEETSLSVDVLTQEERALFGLGRRLVPLYDAIRNVRQCWDRLGLRRGSGDKIDFEKRTDTLAQVLRQNLEHRFTHASDRIDRLVADSDYFDDTAPSFEPEWQLPPFDEKEWATRIRTHIDAWKAEAAKQSRRSDFASISLGMPLLLADLVFLGGAGFTITWTAAWLAGFVGGKSLAGLLQKSPAFKEYQTTVKAYQAFVREALTAQWEANMARMPKRHMPMSDPILEAMMYWSSPGRG